MRPPGSTNVTQMAQVYLRIYNSPLYVARTKWWRRYRRAELGNGQPAYYWYAYYGGTDQEGNVVISSNTQRDTEYALDETTYKAGYRLMDLLLPSWRPQQLSKGAGDATHIQDPDQGISGAWTAGAQGRSITVTQRDGVDLVDVYFALLVKFQEDDSMPSFVCDPVIRNRW